MTTASLIMSVCPEPQAPAKASATWGLWESSQPSQSGAKAFGDSTHAFGLAAHPVCVNARALAPLWGSFGIYLGRAVGLRAAPNHRNVGASKRVLHNRILANQRPTLAFGPRPSRRNRLLSDWRPEQLAFTNRHVNDRLAVLGRHRANVSPIFCGSNGAWLISHTPQRTGGQRRAITTSGAAIYLDTHVCPWPTQWPQRSPHIFTGFEVVTPKVARSIRLATSSRGSRLLAHVAHI